MTITKEIINDVLNDYKEITSDVSGESSKTDVLERLCEKYKELDDENLYAVCMYYLVYFNLSKEEGVLSDAVIEENFMKSLPNDMDELLSLLEWCKYVPNSYLKVLELSSEIFEVAKEVYFNGEVSVQEAEQKLEEIVMLRKEIESQEYKYRRNISEIIAEYENKLSECILDVNTIKGERVLKSTRLGNYIDEIRTFKFSDTNIFNVPNDLL